MGDHILSANLAGYADDIRTDTVGILAVAQMGRCLGQMDDKVSDRAFLWGNALLRKFLLDYILLIINYMSFTKSLA